MGIHALIGRKRLEALAMIASGASCRAVARRFGVTHPTIAKMKREASRRPRPVLVRSPATARPTSLPSTPSSRPGAPASGDAAEAFDASLAIRRELRDALLADFRAATEPRERALLAHELRAVLDAIGKTTAMQAHDDDDDGADEADAFDGYMLRIVAKARVIVGTEAGK